MFGDYGYAGNDQNTGSFTMCGKKGKAGIAAKVKTFNQIVAVESTASSRLSGVFLGYALHYSMLHIIIRPVIISNKRDQFRDKHTEADQPQRTGIEHYLSMRS